MPCDEIRTIRLAFDAADLGVMKRTLEKLGYTVTQDADVLYFNRGRVRGTFANGEINVPEGEAERLSNLKQDYSRETVYAAAETFGWQVEVDPQDAYHLTVVRQTY